MTPGPAPAARQCLRRVKEIRGHKQIQNNFRSYLELGNAADAEEKAIRGGKRIGSIKKGYEPTGPCPPVPHPHGHAGTRLFVNRSL